MAAAKRTAKKTATPDEGEYDSEFQALIEEHKALTTRMQAHGRAKRAFELAESEHGRVRGLVELNKQRLTIAERKLKEAKKELDKAPDVPEEDISSMNDRMRVAAEERGLA